MRSHIRLPTRLTTSLLGDLEAICEPQITLLGSLPGLVTTPFTENQTQGAFHILFTVPTQGAFRNLLTVPTQGAFHNRLTVS